MAEIIRKKKIKFTIIITEICNKIIIFITVIFFNYKQLLDGVFVISRIIKVEVGVIGRI